MNLFRRLTWFFGRRRFEADLNDELRFHEDMAAEEARHQGADPDEARFAARRRVGNTAQVAERARAVWSPPALDDLLQDMKYAVRGLRRRPGYAAAAILTLTLGIGATTALFSVLNAVLLKSLPYADAGRLVQVWERNVPRNRGENIVSPANFADWRARARSFESLAIYTWSSAPLAGEAPEILSGRAVSTNFFSTLGVRPALGRLFVPDDTLPGAPMAMVLSHALWIRRFGGDSTVIGQTIALRDARARVVGVMPAGFRPMGSEEYWEPWAITSDLLVRRGRYAMVIGRLRDGVTAAAADREVHGIAASLEGEYPSFDKGWTADVVPLQDQVTGQARPVLLLLAGAIAAVLLIACANVANLKLGQVLARRTELAVRAALGASRGRILRQMAVEGLVLAAAGGGLGMVAAALGVRALVHAQVRQIPRLSEVGVDLTVLGFALLITVLAGVVFGLAPALALREGSLRQPLSRRGGEGGSAPRGRRVRGALVSIQVALSLMLLTGAGLTVRSLANLLSVPPGFDPKGVLTVQLQLPPDAYGTPEQRVAFFEELKQRLGALRGVEGVGLVNFLPLRGFTPGTSVYLVGQPDPPPGQALITEVNTVDETYFGTMRTPLVEGRGFAVTDRAGAPKVVLINKAFAAQVLKGSPPIGRRIRVSMADPDTVLEVVGVVGDTRREALDVDPRPSVYYPFAQGTPGDMTVVIRVSGTPAGVTSQVRGAIAALDRSLPILSVETLDSRLAETTADRRYPMLLLSLLAALALVLSAVGLYGVLAYIVSQRAREIGLRRALGATGGGIARLVVGEGFRFVGLGLVVGMAASLATTRFLGKLLYGLSPTDPVTLVLVSAVLAGVAALATWLPTRRALRVDPAVTLREEG
ncbi:MAG TPA: ABC transporter permease [Gemmatimonadales bacterium]|nr:ABC transporter permease [Gemmatimonadales bacterium]